MMALSHAAVGVGSWLLIAEQTGLEPTPLTLAAALLGSLLPDIDHPGSWLGRRTRPLSLLVARLFGHRGVTHSLLAAAAFIAAALLYAGSAAPALAALSVGYLSHLLGDFLTRSGIPAFWPYRRRFALPFAVKAGGRGETVLVLALLGAGYYLYRQDLSGYLPVTL